MMNLKSTFIVFAFCCYSLCSYSQYYEISFKKDVTPLAVGAGLVGLSIVMNNKANTASIEDINLLNAADLNFLDRGVVNFNSSKAQTVSDVILYSSATLPFITYFSNKCRSNSGAIALMALETALINNGITDIFKASVRRYRPFNYNPEVDLETKLGSSSRKSFISGHASNTASFAFLTARVLTDLHPNMKRKYLVWTTAATIPAVIGYLRVRAGKHFPTDVIAGYAVGATIGYLIPSMHLVKNENLSIHTTGISNVQISLTF